MSSSQKILIVDDRRANLVALKMTLKQVKAEVIEATNGNQALGATLNHDFALAILDVNMPDMDGLELAEILHGDDRTSYIPIIFLTANRMEDLDIVQGYKRGGVDYIIKPYNPDILLSKVKVFLQLDQQRRLLRLQRQQLQEVNCKLTFTQTAIDQSNDSFLFVKVEDRSLTSVTKVNKEIYGYSFEEWRNLRVSDIIPEVTEDTWLHIVRDVKEGKLSSFETQVRRKNGKMFPADISMNVFEYEDEDYIIANVRNVSERKEAENRKNQQLQELTSARQVMLSMMEDLDSAKTEAEKATRAKSMFLAGMSHEIRTPMNAVLGMLYLAQDTDLTDVQRNYLEKSQNAARLLLGIINDILDFSKIEAGKMEIDHSEFVLDNVLEQLADMMGYRADEKGLEFLIRKEADIPYSLLGDGLRVGQILSNLCTNAIKFTEKGEVEVIVRQVKQDEQSIELMFCVRDTGIGLNPEQQDKLFHKFTQVDQSISRKYGGTGLGLSICYKLAELLGGRCWIEKSESNKGSVFCFTATFGHAKESVELHLKLLEDVLPILDGLRVMVVDDCETSQDIFSEMLTSFNFQVETFGSGREAIARLKGDGEDIDIVLMDWKMEGMDGMETIAAIRKSNGILRPPKMILATAHGNEEVLKEASAGEVDGVLFKPVSHSLLLNEIMSVLGREERFSTEKEKPIPVGEFPLFGGARVLLVEDNDINREFATELLLRMDVEVEEAVNGIEAVEMVEKTSYDAVLMDIQMPEMDGMEATGQIRKQSTDENDRFARLPIIAMTAQAMTGDKEKSIEVGMNDYVSKPINPQLLAATLSRWLEPVEPPKSDKPLKKAKDKLETGKRPKTLKGINIKAGINRIGGNEDAYFRLLHGFAKRYSGSPQAIREHIEQDNLVEAEKLCHTLKGVTGNIGAEELYAVLTAIDDQLKEEKKPAGQQLEQLEEKFGAVVAEIFSIPGTEQNKKYQKKSSAPADMEKLAGQLNRLTKVMDEDLGKAQVLLDEIRSDVGGTALGRHLDRIAESLEEFDIDTAKGIVNTMRNGL